MNESSNKSDFDRVAKLVKEIGEHFDSVQVFATRHEGSDEGTTNIHYGSGNWFTRYGQVKDWCIKQEEVQRVEVRKDSNEDL